MYILHKINYKHKLSFSKSTLKNFYKHEKLDSILKKLKINIIMF